MKLWKILALAVIPGIAASQSTTQTVQVPIPQSVPVQVTVTPTTVTVGTTSIPVPTATQTCGAAPAPSTSVQQCPAGTTGTWTQTMSYTSAPAPQCWTPTTSPTSAPAGACTAVITPPTGSYARPSGNTGTGLYVAGGRINNPDATEWKIRGVNRLHYDSYGSAAGISRTQFNAVRMFVTTQYGRSWQQLAAGAQTDHVSKGQVIIPSIPLPSTGAQVTCSTDNGTLSQAVSDWVGAAQYWTPFNKTSIVNIANEWGPGNSTVWRDQYIAAIKALRGAGYTMPLMIDSGGCGQDQNDLVNYAAAVAAADPQKNIIFSFHLYGGMKDTPTMQSYFAKLAAMSKSNPALVFVVGEFGPGFNIGPSPTTIKPDDVIAAAESAGLAGWLPWAWDDNNLGNCMADDKWFGMSKGPCGTYNSAADLTTFGADMIGQTATYPPVKAKVF